MAPQQKTGQCVISDPDCRCNAAPSHAIACLDITDACVAVDVQCSCRDLVSDQVDTHPEQLLFPLPLYTIMWRQLVVRCSCYRGWRVFCMPAMMTSLYRATRWHDCVWRDRRSESWRHDTTRVKHVHGCYGCSKQAKKCNMRNKSTIIQTVESNMNIHELRLTYVIVKLIRLFSCFLWSHM